MNRFLRDFIRYDVNRLYFGLFDMKLQPVDSNN